MFRVALVLLTGLIVVTLSAQDQPRVDFQRDVQPILRQRCVGCHGPTRHMNGFRLDRRRDALRGGTISVIGPGNSEGSRLYQRIIGNAYGTQMPPNGRLRPEEVEILKTWIDQGAEWPDTASGDDVNPPDPIASALNDALRAGDLDGFRSQLRANPEGAKQKGRGGVTPLMSAALYGTAESVRLLIENGADPNARSEAGTTPLMWATDAVEKTKLLLDAGAHVNETSDEGFTPIMIAAGRAGAMPVVRLLLDRGATVVEAEPSVFGDTALSQAAYVADASVFNLLVDRGADLKTMWPIQMVLATRSGCTTCADLIMKAGNPTLVDLAVNYLLPPHADGRGLKPFLDRGADANAKNAQGITALMRAAHSDALPLESIQALLDKGAEVNAKTARGETAVGFAKLHGSTPLVDLLKRTGASGDPANAPKVSPQAASSTRAALARSLPLLQRTDEIFLRKTGCVSCHHNALTAMTVAAARQRGFQIDESVAKSQLTAIGRYLESWRERALQGIGIAGDSGTISYILLGLGAEKYPRDAATDAMARYLKNKQTSDGRWWPASHRPPIESSDIQVTATSMRALQIYGPPTQKADYDAAIQRASAWLIGAEASTTEEQAFKLLGLTWAGAAPGLIRGAAASLRGLQRPDGGWSQLPTLASDAYATGQALVALRESGSTSASDPAVTRGVRFLLSTQIDDGSWYVRSRALAIQPHFESGFPHKRDQWISAAATNWAAMALAIASPVAKPDR